MRWHGGSFFRLRDARGIISVWVQFRKLGTLSFGKSAKTEIMPRAVYWLFRKVCEQCTRIYVCVMGWDVV